MIDAGQRGNVARFINHACGPNTEVVRWRLSNVEEYQMGIFALEDIPPNTELSCSSSPPPLPLTSFMTDDGGIGLDNYGWKDFSSLLPSSSSTPVDSTSSNKNEISKDPHHQRCFCGSSACTGWLGMKPSKKLPLPNTIKSKTKVVEVKVDGKKFGMAMQGMKSAKKVVRELVKSVVLVRKAPRDRK